MPPLIFFQKGRSDRQQSRWLPELRRPAESARRGKIGERFIVEVQLLKQPHSLDRAVYYTTFPIAESARMNRAQKDQYRKEMRRDWDYKNTMDYAVARGKAEGKAEGLAEGLAQGKEEGISQ